MLGNYSSSRELFWQVVLYGLHHFYFYHRMLFYFPNKIVSLPHQPFPVSLFISIACSCPSLLHHTITFVFSLLYFYTSYRLIGSINKIKTSYTHRFNEFSLRYLTIPCRIVIIKLQIK